MKKEIYNSTRRIYTFYGLTRKIFTSTFIWTFSKHHHLKPVVMLVWNIVQLILEMILITLQACQRQTFINLEQIIYSSNM